MERGGSSSVQGASATTHRRLKSRGTVSNMGNLQDSSEKSVKDGIGAVPDMDGQLVREKDYLVPMTNLIRIMRRVLPGHAKISDDAKEAIQDCVSEYISTVTSEANQRCQQEQRKTITAEDVLWAIRKLGLNDYVEPLSVFLHKFREAERAPRLQPVIRKEVGLISNGDGYHLQQQQLHYGMHGGGGGCLYNSVGAVDGPKGGAPF